MYLINYVLRIRINLQNLELKFIFGDELKIHFFYKLSKNFYNFCNKNIVLYYVVGLKLNQ